MEKAFVVVSYSFNSSGEWAGNKQIVRVFANRNLAEIFELFYSTEQSSDNGDFCFAEIEEVDFEE